MTAGYIDATAGAVEHCETMAQEFPDLADYYYRRMADFCQHKLWHQLTMRILEFVHDGPHTSRTTPDTGTHTYLALYDKVVTPIDAKLHPLSLARMASAVATALAPHDCTAAKALLENLTDKMKQEQQQQQQQQQQQPSNHSDRALYSAATIYLQSKHSLLLLQPFLTSSGTTTGSATATGTASQDDATKTAILASIKAIIQENAARLQETALPTTTTTTTTASSSTDSASGAAMVYAAHYEQAMNYYKVVGPPEAFYEQAMSFLNYAGTAVTAATTAAGNSRAQETTTSSSSTGTSTSTSPSSGAQTTTRTGKSAAAAAADVVTTSTDFYQLAIDLCLAALTGQGVYNLAQVEQTPVLQLLNQPNSRHAWLAQLLHACADGNVTLFYQLSQQYAADIATQPALVHRATAVQEKVTLLALVHLVFDKPSAERTLSFTQIAQRVQVTSLDQVEWIVMRALSVGLIQGTIDQVDQTVHVTWVLPRVLTTAQMTDLATRFAEWAQKVNVAKEYMQEQTPTFA